MRLRQKRKQYARLAELWENPQLFAAYMRERTAAAKADTEKRIGIARPKGGLGI